MSDIFQGTVKTISPAFGAYEQLMFIDIDRAIGVTGSAAGVTGAGTLNLWNATQGVTGVFTTNNTI